MVKTKEQIIQEAEAWRETANVMPEETARRLNAKWRESDLTLRPDTIQDASKD